MSKLAGEGVVRRGYFLVCTKLGTFCYPTVQTAPCYKPSFWQYRHVTDRQTELP